MVLVLKKGSLETRIRNVVLVVVGCAAMILISLTASLWALAGDL